MLPTGIIAAKRDGKQLDPDEIRFMIEGFTSGRIPDYQMSAWAMAVLCRGMEAEEIAALTESMTASGTRLGRATDRPRVDKHSTGGLGDKTSLVLAPLLACFDLDVPMLSGRGLGITGGTLDKLESFPGYRCDLSESEINRQLKDLGCVITGTTPSIAPADRKLYALRDVTGTVPSVPLITASIMSKKLAECLDALVLDVKFGSGAFMRSVADARELSESLVATGARASVPTSAILSDMNQPLGRMVGNACEVNEAIEVLEGNGPYETRWLTFRLAAELLIATGRATDNVAAFQVLNDTLASGRAMERFEQMVRQQGGEFCRRLPLAQSRIITTERGGFVSAMDGQELGQVVIELGGGRKQLGDAVNHRVGLEMLVKIGEMVQPEQPLVRVFCEAESSWEKVQNTLRSAIMIADESTANQPLIVH